MSAATDAELLLACDWHAAPPRERRKWYDWPLFLCGTIACWSAVLALAAVV